MKITRQDGEKLVIADLPILWSLICFSAAAAIGYHFVKDYLLADHIHREHLIGADIGSAVMFFVFAGLFFALSFGCGVFIFQRSVFTFDLGLRQLTWSRTGLFGRRGANVPFDQITGAVIQRSSGNSGVRLGGSSASRVALTTHGAAIPLTLFYSDMKCREICDAINKFLGKTPIAPPQLDEAELLSIIASGDLAHAAQLVSEQRGCTLAEATRIVGALKAAKQFGVLR